MNPDVMISLSELIDGLTVTDAEERILKTIESLFGNIQTSEQLTKDALDLFNKQRERMVERNERLND